MLWHDRRLIDPGTPPDFDNIRSTTLRPFGLLFMGPASAGEVIEIRMGFSLRGCEQARQNLRDECGDGHSGFDLVRSRTQERWSDHLDRVRVEGGTPGRRTVMATALYHSLIKPCFG